MPAARSAWVPIRHNLWGHPKVGKIFVALGVNETEAIGLLVRFWVWVNEHHQLGFVRGATPTHLDKLLDFPGFSRAVADVCWAEWREKGLYIPEWETWFRFAHRHVVALDPPTVRRHTLPGAKPKVRPGRPRGSKSGPRKPKAQPRPPPTEKAEQPEEAEQPAKPAPDESALWGTGTIQFDPVAAEWLGIGEYHRQAWANRHPGLDLDAELAGAAAWCVQNPARGRQDNYAKFLSDWMGRAKRKENNQ